MSETYQIALRAALTLGALSLVFAAETIVSWTIAGLTADLAAIILVGTPFLLRAHRLVDAGESIRVTADYLDKLRGSSPPERPLAAPAVAVTLSGTPVGRRDLVLRPGTTAEQQQREVREWLAAFNQELLVITERLHARLERALHIGNDEIAYFVLAGTFMAIEGFILQVIGSLHGVP